LKEEKKKEIPFYVKEKDKPTLICEIVKGLDAGAC